jgi:ParB family chromosome partitioning protein
MTVKRSGLGRNLSALLGASSSTLLIEPDSKTTSQRVNLNIDQLQPGRYQPRATFDDATIGELAESIKKQGLLQPLLVRPITNGQYEIIAGERRWRACQLIGLHHLPVVVHHVDDETAMAMALIENLQREDLNALDQARAMQRLTSEFALTHQQIADLLSKSRTAVTNYLRLLQLTTDARMLLENGDLDMGHARCLLMLDEQQQNQVAKLVVAKQLSVRETEALVARIKTGVKSVPSKVPLTPCFEKEIEHLSARLQTKITIKPGKAGKGMLMIHYPNESRLQNLLEQLISCED